jgi:2-iminobutanoate/2-iminopropanoate deaminase
MKEEIRTAKAPQPAGPYSQGLKAGPRIYVAGQRPADPATNAIPEGIAAQTRQVLENVRQILLAGGADMDNVVKITAYLSDLTHFAAFNEVYKQFFTAPYPVRTTIGCPLRGILVEVDAIAEL